MRDWYVYRLFSSFWGVGFLVWQVFCFGLLWHLLHPELAEGDYLTASEDAGAGAECLLVLAGWLWVSVVSAALMLFFPRRKTNN